MAVRTKQIAKGITNIDKSLYTVPAGRTAILKYITLYNDGGASCTFTIKLSAAGQEVVLRRTTLAATTSTDVPAYIVLKPGDDLLMRFIGGGQNVHYAIGGSELLGVAS